MRESDGHRLDRTDVTGNSNQVSMDARLHALADRDNALASASFARNGAEGSLRGKTPIFSLLSIAALTLSSAAFFPAQSYAKLSAAPDDDGLTDPEDEAAVDAVNDHLDDLFEEDEDGVITEQEYEAWAAEHQVLLDELNPPVLMCVPFAPPSGGQCATAEDTSMCRYPCASSIEVDGCDLGNFPFNDSAENFQLKVEDNVTLERNEEELLEMAWAIMLENDDLASWASCMYYGETRGVAACLSDKINGNPRVKVVITTDDGEHPTAAAWGTGTLGGGRITIPTNRGKWWDGKVAAYTAAASDTSEEFCIAAQVASLLVHEMVHTCPSSGNFDNHPAGGDEPNSCSTSYLIENGFLWALGQRYPCLLSTSCGSLVADSRWGSDS